MRKELFFTWACIALTVVALGMVYRDIATVTMLSDKGFVDFFQAGTVAVLITALVYGSLVYLFARHGYVRRHMGPRPRSLDELEDEYLTRPALPRLCVLIPSYKEEPRVLRQTILSAALSVYGSRRIVVLIDDPHTASGKDLQSLESSRALVAEFQRQFHGAATRVRARYSDFLLRRQRGLTHSAGEMRRVADLYDFVGDFVDRLAGVQAPKAPDKADQFLTSRIIALCAERHRARAKALRTANCDLNQVEQELRRLIAHLTVDIAKFERKQYRNLSHAPNKAMNLNSYIGLMGKSLRIVPGDGLPALEECPRSRADLIVPDASYLLTLDADSMVLPDYLLKLVDIMEHDSAIAVAQTPYSPIPGPANALERAAGAQTDLQYVVHQGSAASNATFWVGANALLRVNALRTIKTTMRERDHDVSVYIQDRTVIEDTGSTIDLIRGGWKLHNHPERLAYSATPSDFGSLIIQRRRWSNGGLIIFPDLARYALARHKTQPSAGELFLRTHYLCGPALTGLSVLLLLVLPFNGELLSAWLPATILPYYALSVRDTRALKYRWIELLNVYTLNLMLLPITLAGVLRSIQQAFTGRKSSFGRTPKTEHRTPVQPLHVLLQLGLFILVATVAGHNAVSGQIYLAAFWTINFVLLATGFVVFIGPRAAWSDIALQVQWPRLALPLRRSRVPSDTDAARMPVQVSRWPAVSAAQFAENEQSDALRPARTASGRRR